MLDDRNGIRQCANRLSPLFELDPDESEGHDAVAIYFHPYQNQVSSDKLKNNIWTHCSRILTTLRTRQTAPSELGFLFKSLSYRWSKLCRHVSCIVWECFHLFIRCLFWMKSDDRLFLSRSKQQMRLRRLPFCQCFTISVTTAINCLELRAVTRWSASRGLRFVYRFGVKTKWSEWPRQTRICWHGPWNWATRYLKLLFVVRQLF